MSQLETILTMKKAWYSPQYSEYQVGDEVKIKKNQQMITRFGKDATFLGTISTIKRTWYSSEAEYCYELTFDNGVKAFRSYELEKVIE